MSEFYAKRNAEVAAVQADIDARLPFYQVLVGLGTSTVWNAGVFSSADKAAVFSDAFSAAVGGTADVCVQTLHSMHVLNYPRAIDSASVDSAVEQYKKWTHLNQ